MRPRHLIALLAAVPMLIASAALAGPWLPAPGDYYTEFRAGRIAGDMFYDDGGDSFAIPGGGEVEARRLVAYTELGWKDNLSFLVQVPAVSLTVRQRSPEFEATETGLADMVLGLRYRVIEGPTALAIEADWKAPMGYDRKAQPALGDAQQDVMGQVVFGSPIAEMGFFQFGGGYRYRFESPPDEIFGSADVAFWIGSMFMASGHYDGAIAMSSDEYPELERNLHRVGPQVLLRVDESLDLFAGSRFSVAGKNVIQSNEFYIGVAFKQTQLGRLQGFLGSSGNRP